MAELNLGRLLRLTRQFAADPATKDLATGHQASYADHVDRIARLCAGLARLGVSPTDRVGVLAENSHAYVELWHACLAGAAVINPLNTRLAPDELSYILSDSGTQVVFVDATNAATIAELRGRLPELRTVVVMGATDAPDPVDAVPYEELLSEPAGLPPEPDDAAAAVLMYTGGTTGLPKGVVLSQRAIVLSIYRMQTVVAMRPNQRYLAFMPMFHVGGVASWGLYLPSGGCAVVIPRFEPGAVNRAIRDEAITSIGAVPTMLAMMLRHPEFEPDMLRSLELVMYGAAPMPPELLDELMQLYPDMSFHQAYGMTEICAIATGLTRADHVRGGDILRSVGRPCLGVDLEVRHPDTAEPCATDEVGEIWLRGDSLMTEYWGKPEQTQASLVDGWYRTGDAGRVDTEGYLFMADRVKDMIVTGGENVYTIEVEAALSSHPAVTQVAVVGVPDDRWGERVHAVVVCEPGALAPETLADHARQTIAGYKVPKTWTFQADPLPLSAAGKVLKRELRERLAAEQ